MIAWLTDTLVMTGVLMALVLVVRRPVGRWFGPAAAYALWALPMVRFLLPPLALPQGLLPRPEVTIEPIVASAMIVAPASVELAEISAGQGPSTTAVPVVAAADPGLLAQAPWAGMLIALWLGGAAVFLCWRAWSYASMRRELLAGARQVAQAEGVRILESPAAGAPLAFGIFDKVVALPTGFLAETDSENSDFAIAHELEHHAGNDLIAIIAVQPLFALHWFNPLAWAAWRALRGDQEAACDARVMAGCDRKTRARYGRLIASYAAGSRVTLAAPIAGPLGGDKPIIHRLKALACNDISPARRVLARSLFAVSLVAVPMTATVSYAAMEEPEIPESPEPPAPPVPPEPQQAPEPPSVSDVHGTGNVTVPPEPPAPPAPPSAVAEARQEAELHRAEAEVERHAADAERWAAEAERRAAEVERSAARALTRAPQVSETVSPDGKVRHIRIVTKDENGRNVLTREMVIDETCPADSPRDEEANGQSRSLRICAGEPKGIHRAVIKSLQSTRAAVVTDRTIKEDVRSEILLDLDREIERARRGMGVSKS